MGGTQSVEKAQTQIGYIHNDIDALVKKIQKDGNDVVTYITDMKYTDTTALCQKLAYQYVDILKKNFPIKELKGVAIAQESGIRRVQLSMLVPKADQTAELELEKEKICKNIVRLFERKIEVIKTLQKAVPDCRDKERKIHENLSSRMKNEPNIYSEKWEETYKLMTNFNNDIKARYTKISSMIGKVLNASTEKELDSLHNDAVNLIADTNKVCELTINRELRDFRSQDDQDGPKTGQQSPTKPAPSPTKPAPNPLQQPVQPQPPSPLQQPVQPPSPTRPAPAPPVTLEALYNFDKESDNELSVKKGDKLFLIGVSNDEWYLVKNSRGEEGLVPREYVK